MDIKHLTYFKTVTDFSSFTKAAEHLHIAQPAISMAIKKLEAELELTLFHRQDRKISLTDEGQHLYQHACKILQATEDALLEMQELKGLIQGDVRVGIPSMLGSYHFPPILMAFRHRYPQLNLTVIDGGAGKLQQLLETGELDLAVIVDETTSDFLETKVFLREQMMVVCPKDHPFAALESISYPQLFAEELVMFNSGYFHRNVVDRIAAESDVTPNISFETNLIPLIKSIVKQGFAISTLMEMVIQDEPDLVARPFTKSVWLDLSIAWRKGGYLSHANRTFVEFLLEHSQEKKKQDKAR
ncbi:LysR family transcriptional regulator [Neptuniibacter sp. 2_MG-2023]|uniref:LysR family transcriptional regulator n=2 Tax=unclassified Neptuniibacter TaxID=2630693 RepID=UPI0026E23992|nr:LysR family transcriptional regulator [Neptuniibacter sp. 2_MG-2023]MDO6513856.1 LysR family transcriptional regulator [Neptuniibacter sp. 2_MG-2023]